MDRARSRSPHRDEEASEEQHNWALRTYMTRDLKISAAEAVIKDTVKLLTEHRIGTPGELMVVLGEEGVSAGEGDPVQPYGSEYPELPLLAPLKGTAAPRSCLFGPASDVSAEGCQC